MTVNAQGQIIADNGITWRRIGDGYYSYNPGSYMIQPKGYDWELLRINDGIGAASTAHVHIFVHPKVTECMRAAEIHWVRRVR